VGRAWRAPTLFELYANGPRIGEAIYEIGRADLKPESRLDLAAGVEYASSAFRIALSAYHNRIDDFIYLTPTGGFGTACGSTGTSRRRPCCGVARCPSTCAP
jgi:iron complex outermembrane receptor protein